MFNKLSHLTEFASANKIRPGAGDKIETIKLFRQLFPLGLVEAKSIADQIYDTPSVKQSFEKETFLRDLGEVGEDYFMVGSSEQKLLTRAIDYIREH